MASTDTVKVGAPVRPARSRAIAWREANAFASRVFPGVIIAGTFFRGGRREFWDVRDGSKAVTIELERGKYRRLPFA